MDSDGGRLSTGWKVAFALAAALTILALAALVFGARSYLWGPGLTVEDLVADDPAFSETTDVTSEYCAQEISCVEAWETPYGTYMRFDSTAEATHWATIFGGDGAQWKKFVLDTRGHDLSDDERMTAVQILLAYDGV